MQLRESSSAVAQCLPPRAHSRPARHRLPANSTDCHCHVYENPVHYPLIEQRSYTPAAASLEQYQAMCEAIGIGRTVQVSASVYGADNRLTLDVIARLGQARARGVAGLRPDVAAGELAALHEAGMRGVRVSTHVKGYGGTEAIGVLAGLVRPFGWHVQVHVQHADELVALENDLLRLPVPVVFDHMGGVRGGEGPGNPGFQAMLRLLKARDDCWTKISSWYRRSDAGPPGYEDMRPVVEALLQARPDRLVFGTNWPHPALFAPDEVPDDADLVDMFCDWVGDEATIERILVDNPARLYGFEE